MTTFKEKAERARKIIKEAIKNYKEDIAIACSFGKDSIVLLDLALKIKPNIKVFSVITPFTPPETLKYKQKIEEKYKISVKTFSANKNKKETVTLSCGKEVPLEELHRYDPDACCNYFKVGPTKKAIKELKLKAWMSGLRKDEGRTRIDYQDFEVKSGLTKVNPILGFTETDIWKYHACYEVPANPLYKIGYRSLGCTPCTSLIDDSKEERGGRWKGTAKQGGECGIHTQPLQ